MEHQAIDRLLKISEVTKIVGHSKSWLYERIQENSFPRPLRIGPRSARWRESAIRAWMAKP